MYNLIYTYMKTEIGFTPMPFKNNYIIFKYNLAPTHILVFILLEVSL